MVLAGHDAGPVAEAFARAHGLPLLAEPSSNSRFGPNAVGPYRLLLEHFGPDSAQPIERVVLFGRPTLSRPGLRAAGPGRHPVRPVPAGSCGLVRTGPRTELPLDNLADLADFAGRGLGVAGCLAAGRCRRAARARPGTVRETAATGPPSVPGVEACARAADAGLLQRHPGRGPRRSARPEPQATVFANRGLAGIDGTISTATGIAWAASRKPPSCRRRHLPARRRRPPPRLRRGPPPCASWS